MYVIATRVATTEKKALFKFKSNLPLDTLLKLILWFFLTQDCSLRQYTVRFCSVRVFAYQVVTCAYFVVQRWDLDEEVAQGHLSPVMWSVLC